MSETYRSYTQPNSAPFVGRRQEMAQLLNWLSHAQQGHLEMAIITGESGVGKTRLVEAFLLEAADIGWQYWTGHAQTIGEGLPFAPLIDAFRMAMNSLGLTERQQLVGEFPYLSLFFPDYAMGFVPKPLGDSGLERTRLFESLRLLAVHLSQEKPAILWIDNLPESDVDTLEWLQYFLDHECGRVVLIGTCRTDGRSAMSPAYRQFAISRPWSMSTTKISLQPLEPDDHRDLVRGVLHEDIEEDVFSSLMMRSEGVPLYAVEMLTSYLETGALQLHKGVWKLSRDGNDPLPVGIREAIEQRIGRCSGPEQDVLTFLAVSDSTVSWRKLLLLTGWTEDSFVHVISDLIDHDIVIEREDEFDVFYGFQHQLMKEVAYSRLSTTKVRQVHRQLAGAYSEDIIRAAYHVRAAGSMADIQRTVTTLFEAGQHYLSLRSYHSAVSYLEHAMDMIALDSVNISAEVRREVAIAFCEALTHVNRTPEAVVLLHDLLHQSPAVESKIRMYRLLAWVESTRSVDDSVKYIETGLTYWDGVSENEDVLWLLNERVFNAANTGAVQQAELALRELAGYATRIPSPYAALLYFIRDMHVVLISKNKPYRSLIPFDDLLEKAKTLGEIELVYDVQCLAGYYYIDLGDYQAAIRHASTCRQILQQNGMVIHEVSIGMMGICALFLSGQWSQAIAEAESLETLARDYKMNVAVACIVDFMALIFALHGERKKALAYVKEAENVFKDIYRDRFTGEHGDAVSAAISVAYLWEEFVPGDVLGKQIVLANQHGLQMFLAFMEGTIYARSGQQDRLSDVIEMLRRISLDETSYISGVISYLEGCLASLRGDVESAKVLLEKSMACFQSLMTPFELAYVGLMFAQTVAVQYPLEAGEVAKQSVDVFQFLGATALAKTALRLLPKTGGSSEQTRDGVGALSPREAEIAHLVREGLSNKQIAVVLSLSPRTVSTHLERMFEKTGVHSRAALVNKLSQIR